MNERKNCLEGIRAIACIGVFLCHFRGAFIPNKVIGIIDYTPLKIMTAGNPMVRIMLVLSGFSISYKYFKNKQYDDVIIDVVKRWFRLFPGILATNVFVYILMKGGLLYNYEAAQLSGSQDFLGIFNQFTPSFYGAIKEALVTTYLSGANAYIGPLWTMVYEFLGCILVLATISVFKDSYLRIIFYGVLLICFSSYYNYLIIGMMICDIYFNSSLSYKLKTNQYVNNIVFLVTTIIICMIQIDDTNKIVRVIYGIGLVLFFISLLNSQILEKILGNKIMCKIGTLSFAIYIVHWPVIESFSSWYYIQAIEHGINEYIVCFTNLFITALLVFGVAEILNKYVISLGMISSEFWKSKIE